MSSAIQEAQARAGFKLFSLTLVMHSLAAYAFGPVPFPWIAQVLTLCMLVWIGFKSGIRLAPGMILFVMFFVYAIFVTSYQTIIGDYYRYMPSKATTGYLTYVSLRFFTMASFGAVVFITYWLLLRGWREQIIRFMAVLCLVFSLAAIYIYLAQIYGLPEPPRTRMGTGGGEQNVKFTYAFHRALGTFREPSHLAEWLVLPLFMSFTRGGWLFVSARATGVFCLLLTGSLTGIAAVVAGIAAGFVFLLPHMNTAVVKSVFKMVGVGVLGLFLFSLAVAGAKGDVNLGKVLWDRIEPMTKDDGVKNSNRNYVYTYLEEQQVGWFGDGMGNSNLKFTQATGLDATASFLNLFVNVMLSLGYIGLGLFGVFILTPFVILFANRRYHFQSDHYLILSAFFGWLIVFIAHSEELSFHFAITYALLVHSFSQQKPLPMGAT